MITHGMAHGKFGLSVDDIVYSYYGNRENSKIEQKLGSSMKTRRLEHRRHRQAGVLGLAAKRVGARDQANRGQKLRSVPR